MKKLTAKKTTGKVLAPLSAFAAMIALGVPSANAQDVFNYNFPASWGGTGSTITDQSSAGNNGTYDGTISLSSSVPTGASGESLVTTTGGVLTSATKSLNNTAVQAAGGFTYDVSFMWNGTDGLSKYGYAEKLIDYAGTESLQLVTSGSSASLQMIFANDAGAESTPPPVSMTIAPNTWYNVEMTFNTGGNSLVAGDISGVANLYVNGSLVSSGAATKGTYGDGLNRPIGIGQLGANFGDLVAFDGDIYDPSVSLGVPAATPEPSSEVLLGAFGGLFGMWKMRRKKA